MAEKKPAAVATHPPGVIVEIVGTLMGDRGRSCEEHAVCGSVLEEDMVVRLRKVQVLVDGCEETAIACIWVTDGLDRCRVGFLMRHMVKHVARYDVSLVDVRTWTVLTPTTSSVLFAFIVKKTGVWSMFRMKRRSR